MTNFLWATDSIAHEFAFSEVSHSIPLIIVRQNTESTALIAPLPEEVRILSSQTDHYQRLLKYYDDRREEEREQIRKQLEEEWSQTETRREDELLEVIRTQSDSIGELRETVRELEFNVNRLEHLTRDLQAQRNSLESSQTAMKTELTDLTHSNESLKLQNKKLVALAKQLEAALKLAVEKRSTCPPNNKC